MFWAIYLILINICSFVFIGFGIWTLKRNKPVSFLWNKQIPKVKKEQIKQYNRAVSILYIFAGLCFSIVGLIANYCNFRVASICLIIVIVAVFPTLSTVYYFVANKYNM